MPPRRRKARPWSSRWRPVRRPHPAAARPRRTRRRRALGRRSHRDRARRRDPGRRRHARAAREKATSRTLRARSLGRHRPGSGGGVRRAIQADALAGEPGQRRCCSSTCCRSRSASRPWAERQRRSCRATRPFRPRARATFTTYADRQTGFEHPRRAGGARTRLRLPLDWRASSCAGVPPMAAGAARVRVSFQVDADGLVSVTLRAALRRRCDDCGGAVPTASADVDIGTHARSIVACAARTCRHARCASSRSKAGASSKPWPAAWRRMQICSTGRSEAISKPDRRCSRPSRPQCDRDPGRDRRAQSRNERLRRPPHGRVDRKVLAGRKLAGSMPDPMPDPSLRFTLPDAMPG